MWVYWRLNRGYIGILISLFQEYLVQFGYLNSQAMRSGSHMSQDAASKALTDFQMFVGLQPTGILGLRWAGYVVYVGQLRDMQKLTWSI
jgi:hypothetical protein